MDARFNRLFFKGFAKPIGVIAAIGQHVVGGRQTLQQSPRANVIAALAHRQEHPQGTAQSIPEACFNLPIS